METSLPKATQADHPPDPGSSGSAQCGAAMGRTVRGTIHTNAVPACLWGNPAGPGPGCAAGGQLQGLGRAHHECWECLFRCQGGQGREAFAHGHDGFVPLLRPATM